MPGPDGFDRLRDLLSLVEWLRTLDQVDGERIAVWGDSFAPVNPPGRNVAVPLGTGDEPDHSEPLGAALSLLAALFDSQIKAVLARGGLVSMRSVLDSQFVHLPHDFVIPGALTAGDLPDVAAALGWASVRIDGLVDGTNRRASSELVRIEWDVLLRQDASALVSSEPTDECIAWLTAALNRGR